MKQTIKINESQLRQLIRESIMNALSESQVEEGFFRNAVNGVRDVYHAWTDTPEQHRNYMNGRNYDDALYAKKNGQQLTTRQQRAYDKGNEELARRREMAQRSADRARRDYLDYRENPSQYNEFGDDREPDALYLKNQRYINKTKKADRWNNIQNPYTMKEDID